MRHLLTERNDMVETRKRKLAFLGGDPRMLTAAERLREAGYETSLYGFEGKWTHTGVVDACCCSDAWSPPRSLLEAAVRAGTHAESAEEAIKGSYAVILPLPSADGERVSMPLSNQSLSLDAILPLMRAHGVKLLCGGRLPMPFVEMCEQAKITAHDYYKREEFAVAGAIPTAEGAIAIAMNELPITIHGASALVIGYGRIGKVLSHMLASLGAQVSVSARKAADFAWIKAAGYACIHTERLAESLGAHRFDVIFNTVPHTVIGKKELAVIDRETLIVDLASKPGGIEVGAANGYHTVWALSLPGKVAPVTSGAIIAATIDGMLAEVEKC